MGIRIVHLSDLHIHQNSEFDQRVLIDALLEDLKQFAAKVPIDLIVYKFDLHFTPSSANKDTIFSRLEQPAKSPFPDQRG